MAIDPTIEPGFRSPLATATPSLPSDPLDAVSRMVSLRMLMNRMQGGQSLGSMMATTTVPSGDVNAPAGSGQSLSSVMAPATTPPVTVSAAPAPAPVDPAAQFNTVIPADRQAEYQTWLSNLPPQLHNTADYDLQGAFMGGAKPSENQHLTDQWKKPNHMTFSDQSQYSGQGGAVGGKWSQNPDNTWTFSASPTNLQYHSPQELQDYFQKYEPGNKLVLPAQSGASLMMGVSRYGQNVHSLDGGKTWLNSNTGLPADGDVYQQTVVVGGQ